MASQEKENLKRTEYREFLLKQINDKESLKHKSTGFSALGPFSEELITPDERNNLKLQRQQEVKNALDECIKMKNEQKHKIPGISALAPFSEELLTPTERHNLKFEKQRQAKSALDECVKMKNDLKLMNQQIELEEEQQRTDFLKERDDQTVATQEKAKQEIELKECKKKEVAELWKAEHVKYVEREKFIKALLEKKNITDLDQELNTELSETLKRIENKKELLKQVEERINSLQKTLEEAKEEQQVLVTQLAKEKEFERQLKEKANRKRPEQVIPNAEFGTNSKLRDEVDCGHRRHQVLQEQNYQCPNNRFFGLE